MLLLLLMMMMIIIIHHYPCFAAVQKLEIRERRRGAGQSSYVDAGQ